MLHAAGQCCSSDMALAVGGEMVALVGVESASDVVSSLGWVVLVMMMHLASNLQLTPSL